MITSLKNHLLVAIAAFVVLAGVGMESIQQYASVSGVQEESIVNIGIEHEEPASLLFEVHRKRDAALLRITHESANAPVILSLPTTWERKEVRGIPVNLLRSEVSLLGFTRWHIPRDSSVQFLLTNVPTTLVVHNPNEISLKVTVRDIRLETEDVQENIYLIQKDPTPGW